MTLMEILQKAKKNEHMAFGRESDDYSKYAINKYNELCFCWENYDSESNSWNTITRPEYTGFENLSLKDILANDWIEKGVWEDRE